MISDVVLSGFSLAGMVISFATGDYGNAMWWSLILLLDARLLAAQQELNQSKLVKATI